MVRQVVAPDVEVVAYQAEGCTVAVACEVPG